MITEQIIRIINSEFSDRFDCKNLNENSHLTVDFGLDSMDMVRLQVAVEDHYDIRFDPEKTDFDVVFSTPEELSNYIEFELNQGN